MVPAWKQHPFDEIFHPMYKDMLISAIEGSLGREGSPEPEEQFSNDSDPFERLFNQQGASSGFIPSFSPPMVDERVKAIAVVTWKNG